MLSADLDQRIVVLSNSRETLDSVQEYLCRAGARPSGISLIDDAVVAAREADALFFFADDFPRTDALRAVSSLSVERLIVITQDVELFEAERERRRDRTPREFIVLRRPAWGWMLLDALRGRDLA